MSESMTRARCAVCGWPLSTHQQGAPCSSEAAVASPAAAPARLPIRGVRVDGDRVIVSVIGGNDAARFVCGELIAMLPLSQARATVPALAREPAWMAAFDEARDAILNDHGPLEAQGMTNDQTNAVLSTMDRHFMPHLKRDARAAVGAEQVALWQFRWTNPGNSPHQSEDALAWKEVKPEGRLQTMESRLNELRGYHFEGKPCYEVRALYVHSDTLSTQTPGEGEKRLKQADEVMEPLTDEQIYSGSSGWDFRDFKAGVRHAERFHGIATRPEPAKVEEAAKARRAKLRALGYSDTAINAIGDSTTMRQRAIDSAPAPAATAQPIETKVEPTPAMTCSYPKCNCPFDAPADPNWCARGLLPRKGRADSLQTTNLSAKKAQS